MGMTSIGAYLVIPFLIPNGDKTLLTPKYSIRQYAYILLPVVFKLAFKNSSS